MNRRSTMFVLFSILLFATPIVLASSSVEKEYDFDYEEGNYELNPPFSFDFENVDPAAHRDTLKTVGLIRNAGYEGEDHFVTTEDNYILQIHRVSRPNGNNNDNQRPVVLIMHGLLCSSASWVVSSPEKSIAFYLADAGYDVWLGNTRGTTYGRNHTSLSPDDKEFWSFSWHEMGVQDLPAMIDYILEKTNQKKLFYVGHSQGTTIFFVMASERPEYQDKVQVMFALAPVSYTSRIFSPPFKLMAKLSKKIKLFTDLIGMYEFKPTPEFITKLGAVGCHEDAITQPLCTNVLFLISGYSPEQLNKTLLPTILEHTPAGASTKQFVHFAQIINSGGFRQYDYGLINNLKRYGRVKPPKYDLGSIKLPVYLHYSTNDWLSNVKDVYKLYNKLPNAVKFRVPHKTFNHIDFMWGIDARTLLYNKVLGLMSRHKIN